MSVGYSTNLQLVEPTTGTESGNWGYDINYGTTDYIDISVAGTNNITTDADVTLTQTTGSTSGNNIVGTTAQYMQLLFTGSRTAARNVNAPNISKIYVVNNSTTGGYSITVRGVTGPTTGVTVINGEKCIIAWNSVSGDFVKISSNTITSFTGVLSPVNGGTGVANNAASTITISGSFGTTLTVTGTTAVTLPTSGTLLSTAAAVTPAQGGTGVANNAASTITISGNYASTFVVSGAYSYTLPAATDTLVNLGSSQTLTSKTLTNPTVTNYVETLQAVGTVGSTSTLALTTGTVLTATLTASTPCTFTMPTATAGKSFILKLTQAATGMTTATFTSVKWPGGTAPTITATASAVDILSFVSDGTNWYGTYAQAFA